MRGESRWVEVLAEYHLGQVPEDEPWGRGMEFEMPLAAVGLVGGRGQVRRYNSEGGTGNKAAHGQGGNTQCEPVRKAVVAMTSKGEKKSETGCGGRDGSAGEDGEGGKARGALALLRDLTIFWTKLPISAMTKTIAAMTKSLSWCYRGTPRTCSGRQSSSCWGCANLSAAVRACFWRGVRVRSVSSSSARHSGG